MADFDGDLVTGYYTVREFIDRFSYFENTGTAENPIYAKGRVS